VELAPAAIVTVAGTITFALVDVNVTTVPPAGATAAMKTLICAVDPLGIVVGEQVIVIWLSALTVNVAEALTLSAVPLIVRVTFAVGFVVVIAKVVLEDPAGTVTVAGTWAVPFDDVRLTV
jgi:hypothetical protein